MHRYGNKPEEMIQATVCMNGNRMFDWRIQLPEHLYLPPSLARWAGVINQMGHIAVSRRIGQNSFVFSLVKAPVPKANLG